MNRKTFKDLAMLFYKIILYAILCTHNLCFSDFTEPFTLIVSLRKSFAFVKVLNTFKAIGPFHKFFYIPIKVGNGIDLNK